MSSPNSSPHIPRRWSLANTRKMTENLVKDLRPMLGDLVAGHHGSDGQEDPA